MYKKRLLVFFVFAVLSGTVTAVPAVAGKCNPCNITFPMQVTLEGLEALKPWRIIYTTGHAMYGSADFEIRDGFRIADNVYHVTDRRTMKDKSENRYDFNVSMVNNVAVEDYVDDKGKRHRFYDYPLAVTKENAFLFYRCSETGTAEVDTRYIEIPANQTLSDESLQYLLKVDSSCNFQGIMHRLPEQHYKAKS